MVVVLPRCPGGLLQLLGLFALLPPLVATQRIPIEDFARTPEFTQVQLSPDGQSLGFVSEFNGRSYLCVAELGNAKIVRFQLGMNEDWGTPVPKGVASYRWVSDQRLVLTTTVWDWRYGVAAVDRDGRGWVGLTNGERSVREKLPLWAFDTIHAFEDRQQSILMLDRRDHLGSVRFYPDVIRVNTLTGDYGVAQKNPGNVVHWMLDREGVVRLGLVRDDAGNSVTYRDDAQSPWRTLPLPTQGADKLRPLGFDPLQGTFFVAALNADERWAVFPFDLTTAQLGEALWSDSEYDVVPEGTAPTQDGVPLARLVFSQAQGLAGVYYVGESPRVKWFDPAFTRIQAAVDRALPHTVNILAGQSRDDRRLLFFSFSDRHPGTYHLLDQDRRSFFPVAERMPWLKPENLAPTFAVKYPARDGLVIHGYLTVPVGHDMTSLPLVVLPHGGPWVRDTWGFDPLVQLLASRGYGVLQMNYRGSLGYGLSFAQKGWREIGGAIQTDIEDGVQWAITNGVADPSRLAIVGGSYGGYSALFALAQNPDLYRCGVSINGVTDWVEILSRGRTNEEYRFARERWIARIGDPEADEARLRAISPVALAERIKAPVLLVQGDKDRIVPLPQARAMREALQRAGRPVELLRLPQEGHQLSAEKSRIAVFTRMVEFLEEHLGPGLPLR